MNRLTSKDLTQWPDGTWIETDADMTQVLNTWSWNTPRPAGAVYLWRKKQLLDQLEWNEFLADQKRY